MRRPANTNYPGMRRPANTNYLGMRCPANTNYLGTLRVTDARNHKIESFLTKVPPKHSDPYRMLVKQRA